MKQNKIQNFSFFLLLKFFFMFGWIGIGSYGLPLFASLWIFLVSKKKSVLDWCSIWEKQNQFHWLETIKVLRMNLKLVNSGTDLNKKKRNIWEILLVHWRGRHIWVARASKFDVQFLSSLVLSNSPCYGQALHATCVNRAFWFFFGESLFFSFFSFLFSLFTLIFIPNTL